MAGRGEGRLSLLRRLPALTSPDVVILLEHGERLEPARHGRAAGEKAAAYRVEPLGTKGDHLLERHPRHVVSRTALRKPWSTLSTNSTSLSSRSHGSLEEAVYGRRRWPASRDRWTALTSPCSHGRA